MKAQGTKIYRERRVRKYMRNPLNHVLLVVVSVFTSLVYFLASLQWKPIN